MLLADWPDAADAGGGQSVCRDQVMSRALRLRPGFAADCVTPRTGDRAGGVLRNIGAGDFRVAFRYTLASATIASTPYVAIVGPAFVDLDTLADPPHDPVLTAATASWYGWAHYIAYYVTTGTIYAFKNEAGTSRWETYDGGYTSHGAPEWVQIDAVLERTGLTLTCYMGQARGQMTLVSTRAVTAGAGMVGIRHEMIASNDVVVDVTLLAYRAGLTEVP